jgi:ABC-2 type transport system ATP-binding protein
MDKSAALCFVDLHHAFGKTRVLQGLSFEVERGTVHGFVGRNGVGKTTSLKLAATLLAAPEGHVFVLGHDVATAADKARAGVGYMPDEFGCYGAMSAGEYLDFFAAAYGQARRERRSTIAGIVELTGLRNLTEANCASLSRGQRQRLGLARVLVNDPELLLLDEPASGLDPRARLELLEVLRELRSMGKTVLISSHILTELSELCDALTIVEGGRAHASGSVSELLGRQAQKRAVLLRCAKAPPGLAERLARCPGIGAVEATSAEVFRLIPDGAEVDSAPVLGALLETGASLLSWQPETPRLDELFLSLTSDGDTRS